MCACLPDKRTGAEIMARAGSPKNLIEDKEREFLRQKQKRIDRISRELEQFSLENIREMAVSARKRLRQGRGSTADVAFSKKDAVTARKALARERDAIVATTNATLEIIAKRFERVARQVLVTVEQEAHRLGVEPGTVPIVQLIGRACWCSGAVKNNLQSPRGVLKRLGIKL